MKKSLIILACYVLCIFLSCGTGEITYTVETIDGVRQIHNIAPVWSDEPKVELEFVQKIGDLESEDDNYAFFYPQGIVRDDAGNIYVLDSRNYRIQKFDNNGKYVMTMGNQGQGPGEFARPVGIDLDHEGNLLIMDTGNSKIQKYSVSGENLGSIRINYRPRFFSVMSTGEIVIPTSFQRTDKELRPLFAVLDPEGEIVKEIGEPMQNSDYLSRTERLIAIDNQDNIYISYMSENRIEKYSKNGTKIFRADRPLNYPVPDGLTIQKVMVGDEGVLDIPMPTFVSLGTQVDNRGRIWNLTLREQLKLDELIPGTAPKQVIDLHIFDNDGIFLGIIPADRSFEFFKIAGDRLYMIDSQNTMSIYEYRIVEK